MNLFCESLYLIWMCSFYYDDLHLQKVQKSGVHIMCARPVRITVFHHDKSPLYEPYVWY